MSSTAETPCALVPNQIEYFRDRGYVKLREVLDPEDLADQRLQRDRRDQFVSFFVALYLQFVVDDGLDSWQKLLIGVGATTICWIAAAYLTPATDEGVLRAFYRRIQPGGPGWRPVIRRADREGERLDTGEGTDLPLGLLCAALGATGVYSLLFSTGFFIYGRTFWGGGLIIFAAAAFGLIARLWPRLRFTPATAEISPDDVRRNGPPQRT